MIRLSPSITTVNSNSPSRNARKPIPAPGGAADARWVFKKTSIGTPSSSAASGETGSTAVPPRRIDKPISANTTTAKTATAATKNGRRRASGDGPSRNPPRPDPRPSCDP
ncbi:hypothetical protein AHiyo8_40350 [Arthrobacter sp. Hiyo8]|nr:hypothetical protein AHiyo8_40350 [Arthrobacter sp. Hiyo8]